MSNIAEVMVSTGGPPISRICPDAHAGVIRRVLVCLDRSELSDASLPYARFVAEAFGAKVTLLHVMPSTAGGVHESNRPDALEWEIGKREAEQYLHARAAMGSLPGGTATQVTQGFPAAQIVAAARELGADLTVLSSHGENEECSPDLGSTAQRVLAMGAGSVLLVRGTPSARIPPRRILVALDGSLRSECVLPLVTDLARVHRLEVLLVHVVTDPTRTAVLSTADDLGLASALAKRVGENAERYLAQTRARLLPQVPVVQTLVVRRAEERQALLDVVGQESADMVVLTAHGSTCNVERSFGSVASYLLAHAHVPIFVLQDMPRGQLDGAPHQLVRVAFSARPLESD